MADSLLGGIVINEILVDPNGASNFDTDGNGTAASTDEYVELFNSSNAPIDISGLQLWDAGVGNWFTFPDGTILQPGGHALVMTGVQSGGSLPTGGPDDIAFDAGRGSALINNGGDNVTVYDPNNDQFIQATFNGDALDDPTAGAGGYSGFSSTASRVGSGENFGNDVDGYSLQRDGDGADTFTTDSPTPAATNVCFADGTMILTPDGERPVESLRPGDLVVTRDHGAAPVAWVYAKGWSRVEIARSRNLAPVLIRAGALGGGLPKRDLRLSQQHRVLVCGAVAERMFGAREVLIPAKALIGHAGVQLDLPRSGVRYHHVMLKRHEVLLANGVASESLYLGTQAIGSIPEEQLDDLRRTLDLPRAALVPGALPPEPARPLIGARRAARLVHRHRKNRHPLAAACCVGA